MQQYFIEQAVTYDEAERKAREKYGERVTILMHETVKIPGGFLNLFSREGVKITGIIPRFNRVSRELTPQRELFAGSRGETSLGDVTLGEVSRTPYLAGKPALVKDSALSRGGALSKESLNFAEEKEKILAAAGAAKDNSLKEVLAEVRTIKEKLENSGLAGSREEHPTLNRIDDVLILNDFPVTYRRALLERIRREFSLNALNNYDAVQDKVLEWIGESIKIFENDRLNVRPKIIILVGPTGVGKTTTVAKLAANFGIDYKNGRQKRRVVLITIDAYRIGAKEQIETYSEYMEFPCFSTADYGELKRIIAENSEGADYIFVDTIGKNPRETVQLGEMKQLLDACGSMTEIHLAVAASTKSSDLKEILQQFEFFSYKSVIVTKLDETIRTGNIIGVLAEKGKSVSYITNGQKVPVDIKKASVIQFLINLEGFRVNRIKLEEKFPEAGREQMQQWR